MQNFEVGQEIEAYVVQVSADTVFIDIGLKSEGFVDRAEFCDENGNCSVKEGDRIKVYYVSRNKDEFHFTSRLNGHDAPDELLERAFEEKIPVDGLVTGEIKGGFEVKLGAKRAFCPHSQMGYREKLESSQYTGRNLPFIITKYDENGRNIVLSNREVEISKENDRISALSKTLSEGTIVEGTVKSIQSYGAFVDVNGFQALLPVSEISHRRIQNVEEVLSLGDKIKAKIIRAEWNGAKSKISLSMKALEKDPWDSVLSDFSIGDKISGKVSRVSDFGVFVNIAPGIDGLVHISKLDVSKNTNLRRMFKTGDNFDVIIEEIDVKEKRISLAPATSVEQDSAAEKYIGSQSDDGETYNPFAALLKK